jgi:hypothetical protein
MTTPKKHKATIGFWLIQEGELQAVCPSIVANTRIKTMEHLPITNVWNGQIVTDLDFTDKAVITLIPTILTVSALDKDIYQFKNIMEIGVINDKIKELTLKYVKTSSHQ